MPLVLKKSFFSGVPYKQMEAFVARVRTRYSNRQVLALPLQPNAIRCIDITDYLHYELAPCDFTPECHVWCFMDCIHNEVYYKATIANCNFCLRDRPFIRMQTMVFHKFSATEHGPSVGGCCYDCFWKVAENDEVIIEAKPAPNYYHLSM